MLPFEFHIKLKRKDLFAFKMYQVRHSFQGLMAFVFFLMLLFIVFATFGKIGLLYSVLYLFSAIIVLAYFPLIMSLQAKTESANLDKYKRPFDFFISNDGVRIKQMRPEKESTHGVHDSRADSSKHGSDDDFEEPDGTNKTVPLKPKIEFVSWDKIYRVKETAKYFFVFTGRDSAFILPKAVCGNEVKGVSEFFADRLPRERIRLSK